MEDDVHAHIFCPGSGDCVSLVKPDPKTIHLVDIARGLSGAGRYSNQLPKTYSVAQHSLIVAAMVPRRLRLAACLHDAAEAYLGDVAAPLKQFMREYVKIEGTMERAIEAAFGLELSNADRGIIKAADIEVRQDEMYWLCPGNPRRNPTHKPTRIIKPLPRKLVRLAFYHLVEHEMERAGRDVP